MRQRKKMPDDDDDDDNMGEDGKIISLAKESTMPARYCIHTVFIRASSVKWRWTKGVRDQERKRERRTNGDRNEEIERIEEESALACLPVHLTRALTY